MDIHSNLEFLCRVCAANTKKNSVAECVYILKTAGLKDKLDKYLYLKISEHDSLPKVLCKSCFRQVEATASLSKIAKHTQEVFRDFLLSNLPKGPSTNTSEFTSSELMRNRDVKETTRKDEINIPKASVNSLLKLPVTTASKANLPPPLLQSIATPARKEEVVVNVSVADPLTRDNQQKMISNSQRRQSLLLDSRYAPSSIAQNQEPTPTAVATKSIAPKLNQSPVENAVNVMNNPKATVAPSLSFYPAKTQTQTKEQHTPQTTQITTFSSGGYVIGRINTTSGDNEEAKKPALPLKTTPDNILQQKRKNLVKALNNIKANNSGQVSLLKSSQQKQAETMQNNTKTPLSEVVNHVTEDELPEKIIIAAPKVKSAEKAKREPLNLSGKKPAPAPSTSPPSTITSVIQQPQSNTLLTTPPKSAFPDDILLGRVIRDMDLLKLILKALKWPANKRNMELQLQRLKNTKFTDIMSDTNLLQDTDLTQLLSPYLAPVLLAAQALQQQQQQILNNTTLNLQNISTNFTAQLKMSALEVAQAEINKSIPYKLPPETSVQLVPALPEEAETTQSSLSIGRPSNLKRVSQKTPCPPKKQRKIIPQRARDSIVISDEEDASMEENSSKISRQCSVTGAALNMPFELNSNFISQYNLLNGSGANEGDDLLSLMLKQKGAIMKDKRAQRRRRNSISNLIPLPPSEFDSLIDLDDDIVLMEPLNSTSSSDTTFSNQEQHQQKTDPTNTFIIPSVPPLITRPIIKRRKTVIHPPKNRFDLSLDLSSNDQIPTSLCSLLKTKERLMEETINQVATGNITSGESKNHQTATEINNTEVVVPTVTESPAIKSSQQKKIQNKSSLGQQLLEAIGLQKIPTKITTSSQNEAVCSFKLPNATSGVANSKQPVQQIRSALKKSLKQVQEQQQQKKKELSLANSNAVIKDADSTTKPPIKEILVVQGKGNKSDNCSSIVDVEEQIDKVTLTLMVRKKNEEESETTNNGTVTNQKNELKKSLGGKIQQRRRTLLGTGGRGAGARNIAHKEKYAEDEAQDIIKEDHEATEGNIILDKEDSVTVNNSGNEEVVVPKKRGRKRLIDKQNELLAAEANEREKYKEEQSGTASNIKNEEETESNKTSGRPTRQSKTQSKYYKGPEKISEGRRFLPSRTTRNR